MTDAAVLGERKSQGIDEVAGRERMAFALPLAAAAIGAAVGLGALFANAVDAEDYAWAERQVRDMGLDPAKLAVKGSRVKGQGSRKRQ